MSAIQASTGLISGIPIQDTVDQLISVASQPLNRLTSRTQGLAAERAAVDTLASLVLGLKSSLNKFSGASTYTKKTVESSDTTLVKAAITTGGKPAAGTYSFTPLQQAAAHQLISGSFEDLSSGLGSGTFGFRFGGHVDKGRSLSELNNGAGVPPGKIKITDRSGGSAEIDLRAARTVDEVLDAINSSSDINVTASVDGDSFKLTDSTGGTGNLIVQEVGLGKTAAALGLGGDGIAADEVIGTDVYTLHANSNLATLNDGAGVRILDDLETIEDLTITLQDETSAGVDLSGTTTLQDVLDAINDQEDLTGKVSASISADGRRLEIDDLTTGAGTFSVENVGAGTAADDLGLSEDSVGGVITGRRLVSGLRDVLVSSLNGGQGFELADIDITDRAGNPVVNVDLSTAETLGDVVSLINASGANVTAAINDARNGITITDDSLGTGNLVIANGSTGTTADDLGISVDDAVALINSGALNRQTVSESTLLSSLGGSDGINVGDIRITDSNGATGVLDLNKLDAEAETIGDVIDAINTLSIGVEARINDAGDGVLVTDTAGGAGTLTITDVNGTTAAGLGLAGSSTETDGSDQQIINGSTSYSVDLSDLSADANAVTLASLNEGSGVDQGLFQVTASDGKTFVVDLSDATTIGDVLSAINDAATAKGAAVAAQVTESGTGIELIDSADGSEELTVEDLGSGTAAVDLGINGTAGSDQTISSFGLFDADDAEKGALEQLVSRINDLDAGVTASVVFDGLGYRLALNADKTGAANELLIDDSAGLFSFEEVSRPQDAVLLFGASDTSSGFAVSSESNEVEDAIDGLKLTVSQASDEPVAVTVGSDSSPIVSAVSDFVNSYNSIRANLDAVTDFDAEANTTGILFGRNEALRVDTTLGRLISDPYAVGGDYRSLEAIGVQLGDDGKLTLNEAELNAAIADSPGDIQRLLSDEDHGVAAKFNAAINQLAADESSLLGARSDALQSTIDSNNERLESMSESLGRQRERLLLQFYRLEETIAGFQSNISVLDNIQLISFQSSGSSSTGS